MCRKSECRNRVSERRHALDKLPRLGKRGAMFQTATPEMDLEDYRQAEGLTYEQLSDQLGVSSCSLMRRYSIGETRIPEERVDQFIARTDGRVGLYALHRRRVKWLAENRRRPEPVDGVAALGES